MWIWLIASFIAADQFHQTFKKKHHFSWHIDQCWRQPRPIYDQRSVGFRRFVPDLDRRSWLLLNEFFGSAWLPCFSQRYRSLVTKCGSRMDFMTKLPYFSASFDGQWKKQRFSHVFIREEPQSVHMGSPSTALAPGQIVSWMSAEQRVMPLAALTQAINAWTYPACLSVRLGLICVRKRSRLGLI